MGEEERLEEGLGEEEEGRGNCDGLEKLIIKNKVGLYADNLIK